MDREEILLKEYETCQSHNNSLDNQSWVSISILITVNVLVLAQVLSAIVLKTVPIHGFMNLIVVILIALLMIFILGVFWRWKNRVGFLVWLNNNRMREIEENLGFEIWKNCRVYGLDLYYGKEKEEEKQKRWCGLNPKLKEMIEQLSQLYPKKDKKNQNYETMYRLPTTEGKFLKGQFKFHFIFPSLIIIWVITIILEVILYCPFFRQLLYDCRLLY